MMTMTERRGPETRTTSPRRVVRKNYRFTPRTPAILTAIAAAREGLTETQVIENAIELYGRKVLGRRMADLVPVRREHDAARTSGTVMAGRPRGTMGERYEGAIRLAREWMVVERRSQAFLARELGVDRSLLTRFLAREAEVYSPSPSRPRIMQILEGIERICKPRATRACRP